MCITSVFEKKSCLEDILHMLMQRICEITNSDNNETFSHRLVVFVSKNKSIISKLKI